MLSSKLKTNFEGAHTMKRIYIKPETQKVSIQVEGILAGFSRVGMMGNANTGTKVSQPHYDLMRHNTLSDDPDGEEAGSKFHHNWSMWDSEN